MNSPRTRASEHHACCCSESCGEAGCRLALDLPRRSWICLSGTQYQRKHTFTEPLADAMIAAEKDGQRFFVVAELKSGKFSVREVHAQLQNGCNLERDVGWVTPEGVALRPVLVHSRKRRDPTVCTALNAKRYRIRRLDGTMHRIGVSLCGDRLSSICSPGSPHQAMR